MSWRNSMARHGSETNLGDTLSRMHSGTRAAPATSPSTSAVATMTTSRRLAPHSQDSNENNGVNSGIAGLTMVQASSAGNSRIPGPSPTSLRRSASMRVRGERLGGVSSVRHSSGSSILYQQQHQQQQQLANNRRRNAQEFSVITENGTEPHRNRSFSLSLTPARPRSAAKLEEVGQVSSMQQQQQVDDSDAESVKSYGSACSTASACDHAHFALNGTTWSGRSRKYVVHCSNNNSAGGDGQQYLTPTQRAARQLRKFENLLEEARKRIEEKDREISRLTKELVELRLCKASLNSPDDRTDSSSDAPTVREAANPFSPNSPDSPNSPIKDLPTSPGTPEGKDIGSLGDSGNFDDESVGPLTPVTTHFRRDSSAENQREIDGQSTKDDGSRLVENYERRIIEMQTRHGDQLQQLRAKHNDKVESLLRQLSEVNTRYCEMRPSMDAAEAKARNLQAELESARSQLAEQRAIFDEQEERNKQMYLKMYTKGREAARIEQADEMYQRADNTAPPKITMAEVLQRLNVTQAELDNVKQGTTSYLSELGISTDRSQCLLSAQEAVSLWVLATRKAMYRRIVESRNRQGALDPEITLQFLKSAIYYFLTDKENHRGHLSAIESILGFTDNEKLNIDKIYGSMRK